MRTANKVSTYEFLPRSTMMEIFFAGFVSIACVKMKEVKKPTPDGGGGGTSDKAKSGGGGGNRHIGGGAGGPGAFDTGFHVVVQLVED